MPTLNILRGIPGSGKSTFAKGWVAEDRANRIRVNRDALRWTQGIRAGVGTQKEEDLITILERASVEAGLKNGKDVIIDATNLSDQFARGWFKVAQKYKAGVEFIDMECSVADAVLRDAMRAAGGGRHVGRDVIRRIARRRKVAADGTLAPPPKPPKPLAFRKAAPANDALSRAIIVDIDGTLANHEGVRDPYDTSKYHLDTVHDNVATVVGMLEAQAQVILVSGRDSEFRPETVKWLTDNRIRWDELHMRPMGDKRNDAIVKHDIYHNEIADHYNVIGVFDDRGRVLRMWREIGLTTFAVGDTDNNDF